MPQPEHSTVVNELQPGANKWLVPGAVLAGASVAIGAVGAHGLESALEKTLSPDELSQSLDRWDVGVRYLAYHAIALMIVGLVRGRNAAHRFCDATALLFLIGAFLFSGGLFVYVLTGIKTAVHVVPVGGILWLAGWAVLIVGLLRGSVASPGA